MAKIKNLEGLSDQDINYELANGAKFVTFNYCISIIVMTFRRSSDVYFIKAGESTFKYSIPYTLLTLVLGWWGIPWGPIFSIGALFTNITGGKDLTQDVLKNQK
ncbi:MAG: hypothetical protein WCP57_13040 [Bacteroidota bacterium]